MRSTSLTLLFALTVGCGGGAAAREVPIGGTRARLLSGPDGQIAVVRTPEGNRQVEVRLDDLPAPHVYDRDASSFVVWIVPFRGVPVRAGELRYDAKTHYGSANVVTPYDRFRILVTAEPPNRDLDEPGSNVIVNQEIAS